MSLLKIVFRFLKRLRDFLQKTWHDGYYFFSNKKMVEFSMKCKDVTHKIDLHDYPKGWSFNDLISRFQFWLHLSLCQACRFYYSFSIGIYKTLRLSSQQLSTHVNLDKLNQDLLAKHTKKSSINESSNKGSS